MKTAINHARAFGYGIIDGWQQPHEVGYSRNIDHLWNADTEEDIYDVQDRGINLGQFLRAGRKSEAWTNGYPVPFIRKAVSA